VPPAILTRIPPPRSRPLPYPPPFCLSPIPIIARSTLVRSGVACGVVDGAPCRGGPGAPQHEARGLCVVISPIGGGAGRGRGIQALNRMAILSYAGMLYYTTAFEIVLVCLHCRRDAVVLVRGSLLLVGRRTRLTSRLVHRALQDGANLEGFADKKIQMSIDARAPSGDHNWLQS
jgi:hypothetical protein